MILIVGYFVFPALALRSFALLPVALALLAAHAIERRRTGL